MKRIAVMSVLLAATCAAAAFAADAQNKDAEQAPTITWSGPNDGTANRLVATIVNNSERPFIDLRLRFAMAKGVYGIRGGRVIERADTEDGTSTIIVVSVDVPAKCAEFKVQALPLLPQ